MLTTKQSVLLICLQKNNRCKMIKDTKKEDNKNYGSIFIVSLITLLVSAGFIYLLVNIFN